ncbi:MAG: glycerophosphodiester phosphodiesterase [Hyphomicrobiales bacterium]|nr:glycerophosphodiester phosphodiesterase [Hyphomicrobiales bacterium]
MRVAPTFDGLRSGPRHIHVHGHRGARGILPENTLDSFRFTFDIGIRIIEFDILATSDGTPVITHNPCLMPFSTRTEDGTWLEGNGPLIYESTYSELSKFDVGGLQPGTDYASRYPDQAFMTGLKIPRFDTLCELVNEPGYQDIWMNVEIKSDPRHPENTPPIPAFVEHILRVVFDKRVSKRIILQSFDWRILHECARQAPDIPRSYLSYAPKPYAPMAVNVYEGSPWMDGLSLAEQGNSIPALIAADGGRVWSPYHEDLNTEDLAAARKHNLVVNIWTVNESWDIDRMIDLSVDGIITDYPGRVQRRLLERGLTWLPPDNQGTDMGSAEKIAGGQT